MDRYKISCKQCGIKMTLTAVKNTRLDCEICGQIFPAKAIEASAQTVQYNCEKISSEKKEVIDGYQIIHQIGEGGLGEVFLAENLESKEKIVFKFLKIDSSNSEKIKYFRREAQIMAELEHKYIVKFKQAGNYNRRPYFSMEYIEGIDLGTFLQENHLSVNHAMEIVYHISSALDYGLKRNIIHRDIKPSNIMLPANTPRKPKLIDFGLAKCLGDTYYELTNTGDTLGTPYYMPPEQIGDTRNVTHLADMYSLGTTLYYMLAHKPPFCNYSNRVELMNAIAKKTPEPLTQ